MKIRQVRGWLVRLAGLRQRERQEREFAEELASHLEMHVADNLRLGMTEEEARRQALIKLGGVEPAKERHRRQRGLPLIEELARDLRYGARMFIRNPGFTIVAALTLALGIGASTSIFSIVNAVVLDPFPFRDASSIYLVRHSLPKIGVTNQLRASGPEFEDLARIQAFERIAAWESVSRNLTGSDLPERVAAAKVSADFFSLFGVQPVLGRVVRAEDQGAERVLVISHALWQRRFGGNPSVVGQGVSLDDEPYTIIGVMPPKFRFDGADAWFPFPFSLGQQSRSARAFAVLARLRPGASLDSAKAELGALAGQQEQEFGNTMPEYEGRNFYLQPISEFYFGPLRTALFILFGAVGLVLLIACANIANLLLARSTARAHEIAVRQALGASRLRLVRQMMTECAVLALTGGAAGLLIALWGTRALAALAPAGSLPPDLEVRADSRVLLFSLTTTLVTALVFGLWPALRISKPDVQAALKSGAQRASAGYANRRAQGLLVVAEVSLSVVLLAMAGLMLRSFSRLVYDDPGFRVENLLTMRFNRSPARSENGRQMGPFFQRLIEQVKTAPGVEGVAVTSHAPFVYTENWTVTVESEAIPAEMQTRNVDTRTVSADYFRVMGIPLLSGEAFSDPPEATPVAVVNQALARRFWPDETAVGKRLKIGAADANSPWFVIKGVVADSTQESLDAGVNPEVYFALSQMASRYRRMNLIVRASGEPKALLSLIQERIWEVDKDQPVYQVQTMEELVSDSISTRRFAMSLLLTFAGLATALAFAGIYGVMAYGVSQRKQEIGIRMALGACRRDVLRLVLSQGMKMVARGLVIGLLAALAATRLMSSLLYGVSPTDPLTFFAIPFLLAAVGLLACYVPARRATKVDPIVALRYE